MERKPTVKQPVQCIPRDIMLQAAMLRLGDVSDEIKSGYEILRKYHKTATIFGSARTAEDDPIYDKARHLAKRLAELQFAVVTGGGHGIMGAANRGALDAGGDSIGFNIRLPHEQTLNDWTTESLAFSHFAPRKIVMTMYANAYIFFPGGFGTLDELAEILTLIQTGKAVSAPVILFGSEFWNPFDGFVKQQLRDQFKTISDGDENIYKITDDVDEAVHWVLENQTYCGHEIPGDSFSTKRDAKAT